MHTHKNKENWETKLLLCTKIILLLRTNYLIFINNFKLE